MSQPLPDFMTMAEVAAFYRMPVESLRYWVKIGRGPASFKLGRRRLYARADVEAFAERAREAASA